MDVVNAWGPMIASTAVVLALFTFMWRAMDQRFELLERSIDRRFDAVDRRFDAVDRRFDAVDRRFDAVDQRFDAVDQRFDAVDQRFKDLGHSMGQRVDAVGDVTDRRLSALETDMTIIKQHLLNSPAA